MEHHPALGDQAKKENGINEGLERRFCFYAVVSTLAGQCFDNNNRRQYLPLTIAFSIFKSQKLCSKTLKTLNTNSRRSMVLLPL